MFWYCVCPVANKWAVTFDTQCRSFIYDTEEEAVEAARGAAERNWKKRHVPSGVQVQEGKAWRTESLFQFMPDWPVTKPKRKRRTH